MTGHFINDAFKDDNLQRALKGNAIDTVDNDEIKSTKEREGMYPNELDQEMKGYKYGDRLSVSWTPYVAAHDYKTYMYDQGTFAPPYNPSGHFETPYYEYPNHTHSWYNNYASGQQGYWSYPGYDYNPWSNVWAQTSKPGQELKAPGSEDQNIMEVSKGVPTELGLSGTMAD